MDKFTTCKAYEIGDLIQHAKWIPPKFYCLERITNGKIGFDIFKAIAATLVLLALIGTVAAFPAMPWANNPEICKVQITNTDGSIVGVYVWLNNATGMWEAKIGADTWDSSIISPGVFRGDRNGYVDINFIEMTRSYH